MLASRWPAVGSSDWLDLQVQISKIVSEGIVDRAFLQVVRRAKIKSARVVCRLSSAVANEVDDETRVLGTAIGFV